MKQGSHIMLQRLVRSKDGAASMAYGAGAVTMQAFVVVRRDVAAREILFDPLKEF
jgi:hypothetical protein